MLKHQALTCTMVYEHPGANMHISPYNINRGMNGPGKKNILQFR